MSKLKDLIKTTRKANPEGSTLRQAISQARQGESVNVVPREINPVMEVPRFEPVERVASTPPARSTSRWPGAAPSSRGGGFGETESQGEGYFFQSRYGAKDRANDFLQGTLTGVAGTIGSAATTLLDAADQAARDFVQHTLTLPEGVLEEKGLDTPEMRESIQRFNETMDRENPLIQDLYHISDSAIQKGATQFERSKSGWGPLGSAALDVGRLGVEMLTDAAFGAVTGGSGLAPMVARSFGGGAAQARSEGATTQEALLSGAGQGGIDYATERLFGVALPFARLYGGGSLDDVVQRGIQSAVSRFASTEAGQRALGGGLTVAASALTEGAEEFIADWASWQLPNIIYGGDVASVEETLSNSLYDFMLGSVMGGLGGAVSPSTYNYRLPTGQESAGGVVNSDTTMAIEAPEAPGSVQNTAQNDSIPEATRRAVDLLVSGQEISGNQATRIARDPEALSLLGQLTGTEVNTDAPLSRVKADIRAVAGTRAASGSVSGQGQANTQAGQRTTDTSHQAERTAAQRVYDVNRVRGAASSTGMGESGQRAIAKAYDGSVDADRYYAGFTAYYEAGLSGRAREQVRSDYAADLTEAQRFAAYAAGQNDAAASLQREQAGVNYATVYGDEAGFLPSEHSANLSQETTRFYNVLAKATGTKITVTAATGEGGANGWYRNGTIYISSDAQNAGEVVAMHEITHRLQEIAPEAYRKYRDYAVNALSELEGSSNALVERYKTLYSNSGINLTTEEAMDEAAANFAGELIRDPERFERLAREDRGVARRLLDAVKDLIRKIRRAIHGPSAEDVAVMNELGLDLDTLEQAARLWEDALRAGRAQVSAMTDEQQRVEFSDVNTRYSLRKKDPPEKTGIAYKVFYAKNGELYPPMVANPGGAGTPVGVWLDADVGQAAPPSKTGRAQVQAGGKGTNAAKGSLAFRPGWHLGDIPLAKQFARKNPDTGVKDLFPADFVWAECEYAMDVDYQEEAMSYGYTENGKFRHSYAGLPKLPTDGYYRYRTNPNPDTVPWIITGAMRVTRILTDAETDAICREAGVEPMKRQGGPLDEEKLAALGLEAGDVTDGTRFSLKAPVEEQGTLVALHNLTEEKLLASLNLGGFPMPSIAVTRADIPHENFGEITLVMDRRSVDPKANRKNTVYSADAWTPTFPAIEYEADQKAARRISQRIGELAEQVDPYFRSELQRMQYGQEDYLNSQGGQEGVVQWAMDHYGLKAAYLEEQGTHVKPVTRQQEAEKGYNPERAEKYRAVIQALGTTDPDAIGSMNLKELRDQKGEALEAAFPGMTKSALRMSGILRQVQNFLREDGKPPVYETVTDPAETRRSVDAALDQAGYEAWVRELYSGLEADRGVYNNKERFTPAGNSRTFRQLHYPVTLDGIVKAMAGQNGGNTKNVSGFYGVKSLRAGTARRFKSIVDMHKLEGRLQNLTETEQQAIADALDGRLLEITAELAEKSPAGMRPGDYAQMDSIGYILVEIAEGGTYTIDSVIKKFNDEYRYHIGNELAAKVRDLLFDVSQMPVNLFEAKPERAVGFDEVLAAVVPDDSGKALLDGLNQAGIRTLTYKKDSVSDRLEKVNSVEGAKFSLKGSDILRENAALQEENASLRERVEYWRGQTRRTTSGQVDKKAVDRAARELIRDFDSTISAADISGDLLSLYNYMGTGREGNDELTYTEARRRADEIARRVVESAQITEDGVYQEYRELRDYLRSTPLSISQEDASDIADYNDFRRRNFGRLNLRSGDTNIDQVYQELSEMWPEFFDEVRENNPVDQLLHISEVAEQLYRTSTGNPFAGNLREAQAGVSNEILERFFDIPQVRATFADRAAQAVENERQRGRERVNRVREQRDARITQLREQNRERVQRAIQRERDTRERQLERMKNRYQARDAAGRERRTARELRARISRHVKDLSRKLLRPSDKQHIPEQLRTAVAAMLDAINLESVYTVDPETGKRRKGGEGDPTKRTEAFRALREQYEAILNRPDDYSYTGVLDPNLMDNLAEVIRMRDTPLFEMSLDQLTTVWQTVKGVEASITSANKLLGESRYAGVAELAYGIRESSRGKRQKNNYGGSGLGRITGFGDQLLNTDMMNSLTFLHLFGDGGDALYHELQAARDQKTRIMQETVRLAKQVVGKTNVDKLQKKIHTFQVEGGELKLSTAQLMSLYELNQRQQAQDHIYKGGIRPGPRSSFVSRDKSPGENVAAVLGRMDAPSSVVRVTQADVVNMLSELSEEEIRIADGLQSIMQGYLADEGNRESMKVYGYEKFTEDHYFPISSDPNQVQSKIGDILEGGERRPVSVSEWGSAKSTVTGANNGLLLGDIFDVFAQHAVDMSTYASHLGALEDVNRVRNFAFRNAEGHRSGTIKEIIQRVAGKGGNAYLDKLLQDISRGTARGGVAGLSRLTANYKAASVGLNLRVALQQPTSYARALAVMSPKYLADPRVLKSGGWKKALKYAPIAQWKDWGNFEINQGRQFQNILFDTDGTMDRLRNRAMTLASVMDSATWGRLWNACELEILDTRPSLQEGSEEFYSAVAQRFTDVVDQTQVVDNVLGRSQFMRSGDNLAKMAASYMGEPTQTYNMLYRAYRDTVQEQDPKKRSQAIKRLGRTAAAVTFSAFMTAVAAALWDGVRDDEDRDEKYWERVLKHIGPNFAQNVNPVGMLPYARDILSIVQGYDVSRMDLEAVTSLFSALQNMQKAVNGEGRYTIRGAALNLAAELSRITGLPLATVKRDAEAIARAVGVETEDWYFQYQVERALNSVFYSGNRGEFYDIAFGALADGDLDVYEQITQDLMSQGVKGSTIESAMRSRLKAAQESDPNFSMSQAGQDLIGGRPQYHVEAEEKGSFSADDLSPEARTSYNEQRAGDYREWVDALEENGGFGKLDDEGKDKLLSAADQLASDIALRDHSQGAFTETDMDQWERWATKGAEYGVDPSEALLFKTAYDMAESEKDEDGDPISGSKKENALELAADLMPWLTDRELEYLMSNYWAPEDRVLKEMKEGKFLG